MKFMWIDKDKYPNQIPFLCDNFEDTKESIDPNVTVYKIKNETDTMFSQMKVLESCGFLKIIKETNELDGAEDILMMTKRVEKIKSSPMYLKVFFNNTTFLLSENELLSPGTFRKYLLREGKFIYLSIKEWVPIVQAWLDMAEEIMEETEEEQIIDRGLNYLTNCIIYGDINKAISRNTLFHNVEENGIIYCHIDSLMEVINDRRKNEITSRKLRAIFSEYVDGSSIQKRIFNSRYRFWRFKIEQTSVDIERQLYVEEEKNGKDDNN